MNGNPSCQHYRIDNDTWQCVACGERMVYQTVEAETVLSAPNAAPCRDPEHLAAIAAGDDFECSHPYVPDVRRKKTVVIGYNATYRCERCEQGGTVMTTARSIRWDCGHVHRGDRIPVSSPS
jgi:ribosomal protein L37AE/L43A